MNIDFTPLCPELTLRQLNALEADFLSLLDYNVGVKAAVYTNWYFRLGSLCERNSMRMRPLDAEAAHALEIGSGRYIARAKSTATRPRSGPLPALEHEVELREASTSAAPTMRSRVVLS